MATSEELFEQYRGHFVPYKFEAGFVCLSYAVSLIGTGSTLELIRRQTSNRGFHNFLLLTGAAISMGGIAIWSMNYIGNRAISILDGQRELQIAYTTGLTVLSLFIPIIVLFIAFVIISTHGRVCWIRITLSGTISGATFIGMHYLVDASIHNYKASYHAGNIVGAALIAVFANISVLACFFVFESAWTNVWWKRVCSAMLFAGAVSGMQWCAATGTRYRLLHLYRPGDGISRDDSLIAVICLSVGAFVIMIISIIYSHWIKSDYAKKARKVALAAAVFDERGRIMVSQEGLLPSEVITDKFIPTSCNDVFDTSHPVFHWIFWASQNWPKVARVIGAMQSHVAALCSKKFARKVKLKLLGDNGEAVENYNMILCELFCLAALALSSKMKESLETAGSLWDEIFATGDETTQWTRMPSVSDGSSDAASLYKPQSDDMSEKGQSVVSNELGQGSLMFLVRHVNSRRDTERLEAAGYRFAELHHVVGTIRSSMKIKTPDFEEKLRKMSRRSDRNALLSPGAHLGLFAVRARLDYGGFDVLVPKKTKNLLPAVRLQKEHLEAWQQAMVQGFQGLTAPVIVQQLQLGDFESGRERRFAGQLLDSIISLREWVDHPVFDEARFNPQIVQVPCSSLGGASTCSMVAFQLVLPIHFNVTFQNFEVMPLHERTNLHPTK
ncbi:hypothetical protein CDD83_10276 [Cordyceps sp. RAO-2017]|nr:hypothetical protein CDD83_10276 [Cordyceps sp. RAO-2017]